MSQSITPPEPTQEHHNAPDPSKASPLSRFFFLETVFAILLSVLLVVGGLMAASTMVKEGNPDINFARLNRINDRNYPDQLGWG